MPNVFISYVRENAALVDRLADELRAHGVTVWLDRDKIMPGQFWQDAIRQAIREEDYFVACFSAEYVARRQSYMNIEIGLAIEMLQEMPIGRIWFIPVQLSECEVPDLPISGGRTLSGLHREALYKDWEGGVRRILRAMGVERAQVKSASAKPVESVESAWPDLLVIDKPLRLELVRVPAGDFLMGSDPAREKDAQGDDKPQHRLSLSEFYIDRYPVTNDQYAVFVQQTHAKAPEHWQGGKIPSGKEQHPVVRVSWYDARAFCQWISEASGESFRLASEAEWEKAARGVDGRVYPWGDQAPTAELCNFSRNIGDTTAVDQYPKGASRYGALDMVGNVFEWTHSLFKRYPYNSIDGREDEGGSEARVVRGGSCFQPGGLVRCAYRSPDIPDHRLINLGFRLVSVSSAIMPLDSPLRA